VYGSDTNLQNSTSMLTLPKLVVHQDVHATTPRIGARWTCRLLVAPVDGCECDGADVEGVQWVVVQLDSVRRRLLACSKHLPCLLRCLQFKSVDQYLSTAAAVSYGVSDVWELHASSAVHPSWLPAHLSAGIELQQAAAEGCARLEVLDLVERRHGIPQAERLSDTATDPCDCRCLQKVADCHLRGD
jgi:hypothetical protein